MSRILHCLLNHSENLIILETGPEAILILCSRQEANVLTHLVTGKTNKQIAIALGISPHTARDYVCAILQRNGLNNRVALASRAALLNWKIRGECEAVISASHHSPRAADRRQSNNERRSRERIISNAPNY